MNKFFSAILLLTIGLLTIQSSSLKKSMEQLANPIDSAKGLKDFYKNYFQIGVSVGPSDLSGDEVRLILKQFNSLTPENVMKMRPIHPEENRYH